MKLLLLVGCVIWFREARSNKLTRFQPMVFDENTKLDTPIFSMLRLLYVLQCRRTCHHKAALCVLDQ